MKSNKLLLTFPFLNRFLIEFHENNWQMDYTMHLENPSYNFDSIFVFILYDKMKHFKEQASSVSNLEEEFLKKYNSVK